jgi:hypothetical protein
MHSILGSTTRVTGYSLDLSILDSVTRQASIAKSARGDSAILFHLAGTGVNGTTLNVRRPAIEQVFHTTMNSPEHLIAAFGGLWADLCWMFF